MAQRPVVASAAERDRDYHRHADRRADLAGVGTVDRKAPHIMTSIFEASTRQALAKRFQQITPESQRRSMTSAQAVAHLTDALKMALGDLPIALRKTPLRFTPIKQLIIYVAPFPKGAPTAPELIARSATDFDAELRSFVGMLDRCADPRQPLALEHPAFGKMSRRDWGVLIYRHTDHHLRQFGA
jgi:hypothetical protein